MEESVQKIHKPVPAVVASAVVEVSVVVPATVVVSPPVVVGAPVVVGGAGVVGAVVPLAIAADDAVLPVTVSS